MSNGRAYWSRCPWRRSSTWGQPGTVLRANSQFPAERRLSSVGSAQRIAVRHQVSNWLMLSGLIVSGVMPSRVRYRKKRSSPLRYSSVGSAWCKASQAGLSLLRPYPLSAWVPKRNKTLRNAVTILRNTSRVRPNTGSPLRHNTRFSPAQLQGAKSPRRWRFATSRSAA